MIAVWHIMPALRAGNVVISKPSEYTPLSTLRLCEIIQQEVPAGVISIVVGAGEIGEALSSHPDVQKLYLRVQLELVNTLWLVQLSS